MTIDEAIKIIQQLGWNTSFNLTPHQSSAVQLGIEALKRVSAFRQYPPREFGELLPGETSK